MRMRAGNCATQGARLLTVVLRACGVRIPQTALLRSVVQHEQVRAE